MLSKRLLLKIKASNSRIIADIAARTAVFISATLGISKATLTYLVA
jgi:hypothetical protein